MDKSIKAEGAYRPLVAEFNGYWDTPLASLPERLQRLIRADRGLLPNWDRLHQNVRRLLAEQQDAQRDPCHARAQEHDDDFDREAQRQALEAKHLAVQQRRHRYERAKAETAADLDTQDRNLALLDAKLAEISDKLAAIDREQAAAEQQSDPAGQLTTANTKVEPLAEAARYTDSAKGIEAPRERQDRRLARLRELGGEARQAGEAWQFSAGKRGALARLIREESEAGRPMAKASDLRRDLARAAEREMKGDL